MTQLPYAGTGNSIGLTFRQARVAVDHFVAIIPEMDRR